MGTDNSRQVDHPLAVREDEAAYFVVIGDDDDDWLVRFEKAPEFLAQEWALNMANTYNERLGRGGAEDARWTARAPDLPAPDV